MSSTTNPAALKRVDTPRPDWLNTTGASIYQMTALNSMDPNVATGKRKRTAAKKRSNKKPAPLNWKIEAFEIDLLATIPGESLITDLGIELQHVDQYQDPGCCTLFTFNRATRSVATASRCARVDSPRGAASWGGGFVARPRMIASR